MAPPKQPIRDLTPDELREILYARKHETAAGCWEWLGARISTGYGEFRRAGHLYLTHRASWIAHFGPIPKKFLILHHCDNPPCFRPDHLFLGTDQDNVNDKIAKGRMRHGHVYGDNHPARKHPETYIKCGEEHQNARINWDIVRAIRFLYNAGHSKADIAKLFEVNRGTVYKIVNNQQWIEEVQHD